MAQDNIELPEPNDIISPGGANADDLLAQMADAEIDRLLSDADVQPQEAASESPAQAATADPAEVDQLLESIEPTTGAEVDSLLAKSKADATAAESSPQPSVPTPSGDSAGVPDVAAQLDELFQELTGPQAAVRPPAASEGPAAPVSLPAAPASAAPSPMAPAAAADPAEQTNALERQVISAELLSAADGALKQREEPEPQAPATREDDDRLPWYLRPLEWINLPLAQCSQRVRDIMGKAAILTLLNALGILVYVLFIRQS